MNIRNFLTAAANWLGAACLLGMAPFAVANPVVYTLRTVADGQLGSHSFYEALVTIRLSSDTDNVRTEINTSGDLIYSNHAGTATVTIFDGVRTTTASFAAGEVYVRYDVSTGVAGFGSAISPTYPIALDCDDYAYPSDQTYTRDCLKGDWFDNFNFAYYNGTLSALADPTGVSWFAFSPATLALPQSLRRSTLLTGRAHFCASTYTIGVDYNDGDLQTCSAPASRGLRTDRGGFMLQDQIGGSTDYGWQGWGMSNVGALQVEVMTEGDD